MAGSHPLSLARNESASTRNRAAAHNPARTNSKEDRKGILGEAPDIVFEHVGQATFPTSVFLVKPFGKIVICGATSGFQLDFDVRYLWMRQKQIIGSHAFNAYEAWRANELVREGKIRPVIWRAIGFEDLPEAHRLIYENRHLGKISILVGATDEDQGQTTPGPGAIRIAPAA